METITQKPMSDYEKLQQLGDQPQRELIFNLFSSEINYDDLLGDINGVMEWYEIYLLSPEFQKLDRERQKETFIKFKNIDYLLRTLDKFEIDNKLNGYNYEFNKYLESL